MNPKRMEKVQSEKLTCIDLAYLKQRTKSNPKLMMEMISIYLEQTPALISVMKQSLQDKNFDLLNATAHKMVPSFSIMGINTHFEDMAKKKSESYKRTTTHMKFRTWSYSSKTFVYRHLKN